MPFWLHRAVKYVALLMVLLLECSCTNFVNRRDLYSPEPAPDSYERSRELSGAGSTTSSTTATTTTTTTTTESDRPVPAPPPFR
jgi:hypothetical protein